VTTFELLVEILEEAHLTVPAGAGSAVARQLDEIEVVEDGQRAREIGREHDARLEQADEERLEAVVVAGDLGAQLPNAPGDLVSVQVNLADARVAVERAQLARSKLCRLAA
jgi:hypothetical protein